MPFKLANEGKRADLLFGNNVMAQVPDLNDFVAGLSLLLKPEDVITIEFPHLMRLVAGNQFDTIYHEHFSYFSFITVEKIFSHHGLTLFDVEELPTHGGSLRIYARHSKDLSKPVSTRVSTLMQCEQEAGLTELRYYSAFEEQVKETKRKLLDFLIRAKRAGKSIAGYVSSGEKGIPCLITAVSEPISWIIRSIVILTNMGSFYLELISRFSRRKKSWKPGPIMYSFCRGILKMKSCTRLAISASGEESLLYLYRKSKYIPKRVELPG